MKVDFFNIDKSQVSLFLKPILFLLHFSDTDDRKQSTVQLLGETLAKAEDDNNV